MAIEIKPETRELVEEEIRCGHFASLDEIILEGVKARDKSRAINTNTPRKPRKNLADFLLESPFHGSELRIERQRDFPRDLDLG